MKAPVMKPSPAFAALSAKLEQLEKMSPNKFEAVDILTTMCLSDEKKKAGADADIPRKRSLLFRLQAAHVCRRMAEPRFTQLPRPASGIREWRCGGCGAIVTLDGDERKA